MVSPFDVYLVMQLDRVVVFLGLGCAVSAVVLFIAVMSHSMDVDIYSGERSAAARVKRDAALRKWWIPAAFAAAFALMPSSKTAAAMILVPALTSDAVVVPVTEEARELYGLAKDALRSVAERERREPADGSND